MHNTFGRTFSLFMLVCLLAGCSLPFGQPSQSPAEAYTQAAETIMMTLTLGAFIQQASDTPIPPTVESATQQPATATSEPSLSVATDTPAPTITATSTYPKISANVDTNCRSGPGAVYPIITGLFIGQTSDVLGRNNLGTWWYIRNPEKSSATCWVWTNSTSVDGNTSNLPVIAAPPTPTPELPTISMSSSVSTKTYSGACPVDITLRATIETDMPTTVKFRWISDFPYTFDYVTHKFTKAEEETWFQTITINADTVGYLRLKLYNPFVLTEDKIKINIDCIP